MFETNATTKYDNLSEVDILQRTLNVLDGKPELAEYFITNISECAEVCSHGRATRLIDVIAMAQDIPIMPDALLKKQLREQLQSIYTQTNQDADQTKQTFTRELEVMRAKGIIG